MNYGRNDEFIFRKYLGNLNLGHLYTVFEKCNINFATLILSYKDLRQTLTRIQQEHFAMKEGDSIHIYQSITGGLENGKIDPVKLQTDLNRMCEVKEKLCDYAEKYMRGLGEQVRSFSDVRKAALKKFREILDLQELDNGYCELRGLFLNQLDPDGGNFEAPSCMSQNTTKSQYDQCSLYHRRLQNQKMSEGQLTHYFKKIKEIRNENFEIASDQNNFWLYRCSETESHNCKAFCHFYAKKESDKIYLYHTISHTSHSHKLIYSLGKNLRAMNNTTDKYLTDYPGMNYYIYWKELFEKPTLVNQIQNSLEQNIPDQRIHDKLFQKSQALNYNLSLKMFKDHIANYRNAYAEAKQEQSSQCCLKKSNILMRVTNKINLHQQNFSFATLSQKGYCLVINKALRKKLSKTKDFGFSKYKVLYITQPASASMKDKSPPTSQLLSERNSEESNTSNNKEIPPLVLTVILAVNGSEV